MARKRSGIDWSLTSCCGVKAVKASGIARCPKCLRNVAAYATAPRTPRFEQHEREFDREHPKEAVKGRLDRELK